jgi:pimeloyl-ACP methyl ester carboxylesterase
VSARTRRLVAFAAVAALAIGALAMMDSVVRSMVYPAPPVRVPSPPPKPLVEAALEAGAEAVSAWYLPPTADAAPVVLMLHGNGENLETMRQADLFGDFGRQGAGVLAVDYPGYGRSAGTPSEDANLAAAEAGWDWLGRNAPGRPRVVAGWSLGAAVAAQLAARRGNEVAGVMLLSPWDRLAEVARIHFPAFMVGALLPEKYDSAAAAARIAAPALVVHGDRDDIIPVKLGRRLYEALPEPKRWVEVRGAGHNDLLARREAWQAITAFLGEIAEPRTSP